MQSSCVRQVEMSQSYSCADWQEDLKRMLRRAGVEGARCLFLFSDTEVMRHSTPCVLSLRGWQALLEMACQAVV